MAGLTTGKFDGLEPEEESLARARRSWEQSMERRLAGLRADLSSTDPFQVAERSGASLENGRLVLRYWDRQIALCWPALEAVWLPSEARCDHFNQAMVLFYLLHADGTPVQDRWIGFREVPSGGFYHRAFQTYSGDLLGRAFGDSLPAFERYAMQLAGRRRPELAEYAFAFQVLPRVNLAAVLWPGDEDFAPRGAVLFEASSQHYLPTDGLALLGGGLASRLVKLLVEKTGAS